MKITPNLLGFLAVSFVTVRVQACAKTIEWVLFPDGPPAEVTVNVGDCVQFNVNSGFHDLWEMKSWGRARNCNFDEAEELVPMTEFRVSNPQTEIVVYGTPGVYAYACKVGLGRPVSHCEADDRNMHIKVLVTNGNNRRHLRH